MRRLAYATVFLIGVSVAWSMVGPGFDIRDYGYQLPDVTIDWLVAHAAIDGTPTQATIGELAAPYGMVGTDMPAPRPPIAVLAALPLLLVPADWLVFTMGAVNVAAVLAVGWVSARIAGISEWWFLAAAAAFFAVPNGAVTELFLFGNVATVVSLAVVVGWWLARTRPRIAGVLLGVAAGIKLWPALILFVMPRRVVMWAVASGAALSVVGLLLPGVEVGGLAAMLQPQADWLHSAHNVSVAGSLARAGVPAAAPLGFLVGGAVWLLGLRMVRGFDGRVAVTVVAALLMAPYSWMPYWFSAVPAVGLLHRWIEVRRPVDPEEVGPHHRVGGGGAGVLADDPHEVGT